MSGGFFISRSRVYLLIFVICLFWTVIAVRIALIQLHDGTRYSAIAANQARGEIQVPAERGRIFDAKGRILAGNIATQSFFAYPQTEEEAEKIAAFAAAVTGERAQTLTRKLKGRVEGFTWLARRLDEEAASRWRISSLPGLYSQRESRRVYPSGGLGRDLMGAVDVDNHGISGLEYALNDVLEGAPGRALVERDAVGNTYRVGSRDLTAPVNGNDVTLTIDLDWQAIVESELRHGVDTFSAQAGMAVFLRPHDGAVLAMASYYPAAGNRASQKNEAIADLFEPGSVFKIVAAAGALEEGVLRPQDRIFCGKGQGTFSNRIIRDDKRWDTLSLQELFTVSSNVGIGKVACRLGAQQLFRYSKYFGFGLKSGIDLPGEMPGSLKEPKVWSDFYTASLAMGHGVSVTSLQLATAFSVIASDGILYQPYIVKEVRSALGNVLHTARPTIVRTVISPQTSATMQQFLRAVVDTGTARSSRSELVTFAGKTGTAQKPNLQTGGYYHDQFVSSFAGHFPAESPIAVGVVILDNAQPLRYAGMTSARIFRRIAERVAALEKLPPPAPSYANRTSRKQPKVVKVPSLEGLSRAAAKPLLDSLALQVSYVNEGDLIVKQIPEAGESLTEGERIILHLRSSDSTLHEDCAELVGLSIRHAVDRLLDWGYDFVIEGHGYVRRVVPLSDDARATPRNVKLICSVD